MAPPAKTRRKRLMDPALLERVVADVGARARAANVAVALIGGLAMLEYGSDRVTFDVDVVGDDEVPGLDDAHPNTIGGTAGTLRGVDVDVVVRNDDYAPLYADALIQAKRMRGVPVPVVTPDYLAVMKLQAGRPKDDADLDYLIATDLLDLVNTRRLVKKHLGAYAAEEFDARVASAAFTHPARENPSPARRRVRRAR